VERVNYELMNELIGCQFCIAEKHPYWNDLYRFGFGDIILKEREGETIVSSEYSLHVLCSFEIGRKKKRKEDKRIIDVYDSETSREKFQEEIRQWYGLKVKDVRINKENDLLLNLGECVIFFSTYLDGEESWRFFKDSAKEHLVATNEKIEFE